MSARQTSVCLECCGTSDLQNQKIRSRDVAIVRLSLVANTGMNHVLAGVLAYHCKNGLARQYLADNLHQVAEVESR